MITVSLTLYTPEQHRLFADYLNKQADLLAQEAAATGAMIGNHALQSQQSQESVAYQNAAAEQSKPARGKRSSAAAKPTEAPASAPSGEGAPSVEAGQAEDSDFVSRKPPDPEGFEEGSILNPPAQDLGMTQPEARSRIAAVIKGDEPKRKAIVSWLAARGVQSIAKLEGVELYNTVVTIEKEFVK